jgi:hypothetical protein
MALINLISGGATQSPPPNNATQPPADSNGKAGASEPATTGTSNGETQGAASSNGNSAAAGTSTTAVGSAAPRESAPITGASAQQTLPITPRTAAAIDQLREAALANLTAMQTQSLIEGLGEVSSDAIAFASKTVEAETAPPQASVATVKEAYREDEPA